MTNLIEKIISENKIISEMVTEQHIRTILTSLEKTKSVIGDIVEFGCNIGTTSLFIQRFLLESKSNKKFYVYDSFEGLPENVEQDLIQGGGHGHYPKGSLKCSASLLINNFDMANLPYPNIVKGWFNQIPNDAIPDNISFAFFDGDLYSSIFDSFNRVYHRVSKDGIIGIHDYQWDILPGVESACEDFLNGKPENGTIINEFNLGVLVKK